MPLGRGHILPQTLLLLNVLLDALKFILEGREELRVTVVEEFAVLVFSLLLFNFGLLIGQTGAFYSHILSSFQMQIKFYSSDFLYF